MKKSMSRLCALGLTAALAFGSVMPTNAASFVPSRTVDMNSGDLVQVQYRRDFRRGRHHMRGNHHRRDHYNGHRGYRRHRPGYRRHNGYWFPPAAFVAGAILGGATRHTGVSRAHIRYCEQRYRSYRASDNTFQPYHGPRQQCR